MSLVDLPFILILPILVVLSGLVSGSETALFSLTHGDRVRLARTSPHTSAIVNALLIDPRMLLISVLLFNMTINVTYFVITSVLVRRASNATIAVVISLSSLLVLILLGEVLAKLLAKSHRVGFCRFIAGPLLAVHRIIGPLRQVLATFVIAPLSRVITPARHDVDPISLDELDALLQLSSRDGTINSDEERLLSEVIELGTLRVRDVMTPRIDMRWLDDMAEDSAVLELVRETRMTKIPLCHESPDDEILGFFNVKPWLVARERSETPPAVRGFVEQPRFVPETARLDHLLDHFRSTHTHVALCVDELGALAGLVEIEDVVEELVQVSGDVLDAHEEQVQLIGLGRWRVPGRLGVRALTQFFLGRSGGILPEEQRISTVAGLILVRLGRLPTVGDTVQLGNLVLEVASMSGRVIEEVVVTATEAVKDSGDTGDAQVNR